MSDPLNHTLTPMDYYTTDTRSFKSSGSYRSYPIPSPDLGAGRPKRFDPWTMSLPVVLGTPLLMAGLGVALEVGLALSNERGGFNVPPDNVIQVVSAQFLLSFVPIVLVAPFGLMWRELDWMLRWYQPYVVLWKGRALAEESLLLDYVALGPILTIFRALKYRHRIILWSAITALVTYSFQPLAGSIFQLRQRPKVTYSSVTSVKTIGLTPDVDDLSAFVAAAGFAEAAVFQHLPDPPFIRSGWATAEFTFPINPGISGGSMVVNTSGIQTKANCANPFSTSLLTNDNATFIISSTSVDGCAHNVTFNPSVATRQYGVDNVPCPGSPPVNISFQPVMFWFFHNKADTTPEARAVFCAPTIKALNAQAFANLADGSLSNVVTLGDFTSDNNVTGGALAGKAFNAVIFPDNSNSFIQARASATRSGVSGAIFRLASQTGDGLQSIFDLPNGFLDLTSKVYTQHLSVTAKSIYFVNTNETLPAEMTSPVPILWIDPLPTHILATALIFTGIIGLALQILHRRYRKKLLLAAPPGSIAAVVSLTSRSGFGDLLLPYDDEETIERKLNGLRFRTDRRTGAILSDDNRIERVSMGSDDAILSLLGQHKGNAASSQIAFQAAAGYAPWEKTYKPPYYQ